MIPNLDAPKIDLEQLQYKQFVNEDNDQNESKSPKKEPSKDDIEAQDQKITKKAKICPGTIFWVFLGIALFGLAASFLMAYCSYYDGKNDGIEVATKVAEEYFDKNVMVRARIEVFGDEKGLDSDYFRIAPLDNSQIERLSDIMAIVRKYEEECKSPKLSDWMGAFYVTNSCIKKLKEKHYFVSDTGMYLYIKL